ncbi:acyltransferase family protein [Ampullimonas aquatilis]|uniref:acyltransferase family protein n=1 Tax=Ampullimonas aquatilis TaxID=1341549 RepID=UPI003C70FF89
MAFLSDVHIGKENNLTFIRLFAALAVIYGHASAIIPNTKADWVSRTTGYAFSGGVAVDLFFLISGFLVTASIINGGPRHYVISRIARIYPALWAHLILVTFILGSVLTKLPLCDYITNNYVWSYFINLATTSKGAFFLPGVFEDNLNHAINGSIWSVLIEVWLYICVLLLYFLGLLKSRATFNVTFFILIIVFWQNNDLVPSFFSGATNLHVCFMFFIGSFLFINRHSISTSPYYLFIAILLAGITIGTDRFVYTYILVLVTFFCSTSFSSQFSWMNRFGDYSFGVYLYGWTSQQLIAQELPNLSATTQTLISMGLSLLLGMLSWHLIEKRVLRIKNLYIKSDQ